MTDSKIMDTFPDEILMRIFQYVPPEYRRNSIQLVCQRWHRICLDALLQDYEKLFVVNCVYTLPYLTPFLKNKDEPLELLFVQKAISVEDESGFWTSCGPKIKSLHLRDCPINFVDFRTIFDLCPNLSNFSMTFVRNSAIEKFFEGYSADEHASDLLSLVPSVTSFRIRWNSTLSKGWWFPKNILTKFPNLAEVELSYVRYKELTYESLTPEEPVGDQPTVDAKKGCFQNIGDLDKLTLSWDDFNMRPPSHVGCLRFIMHGDRSALVAFAAEDMRNMAEPLIIVNARSLKELSVLRLYHEPHLSLVGFQDLENLTSLSIECVQNDLIRGQYFMTFILDRFVKLRILKLTAVPMSEIIPTIIHKLLDSDLKMLQISLKRQPPTKPERINGDFPFNETLEGFALMGNNLDEQLGLIFTKFCRNLKYIHISSPSNRILQNIFKNQRKVTKLTLDDCRNCTDLGFTGTSRVDNDEEGSYSIKDLTELQCLQLSLLQLFGVTAKTFSRLVLPQLKCLRMSFMYHPEVKFTEPEDKIPDLRGQCCDACRQNRDDEVLAEEKALTNLGSLGKEKKGCRCWTSKYSPDLALVLKALIESLNNFPLLQILRIHFYFAVPPSMWRPALLKLKSIRYLTICKYPGEGIDVTNCVHIWLEYFEKTRSLCVVTENHVQFSYDKLTRIFNIDPPSIVSTIMEEINLKWPYSFQPTRLTDHYLGGDYYYF